MPDRRDAFLAAAEIALAVEAAAKSTGSRDTVGTCGVCDVFPGAVNSIPSRVRLEDRRARYRPGAPRWRVACESLQPPKKPLNGAASRSGRKS